MQQDFGLLKLTFEKLLVQDIHLTNKSSEQGNLFEANTSGQNKRSSKSILSKLSKRKTKVNNTTDILHFNQENHNPYPAYISLIADILYKDYHWDDCKKRVLGVSGVKYKKVKNKQEENLVLKKWGRNS